MAKVKDKLQELGVTPSKGRGQNFLLSQDFISEIVRFGEAKKGSSLLEIGPGLGALTGILYEISPDDLTLVEIESEFCKELSVKYPKAKIHNEDIRNFDFTKLNKGTVVFGNVPYSFSTEIIFSLIKAREYVSKAILLLQKEFAERVCADPGGREYGRLSVGVQLYADTRLGPVIGGQYFHPPARVDSQVLELNFLPAPRYKVDDAAWFEKVVKSAFHERRKKIFNSLYASGIVTKEQAKVALDKAGISLDNRAEVLSIKDFVRLSEEIQAIHVQEKLAN